MAFWNFKLKFGFLKKIRNPINNSEISIKQFVLLLKSNKNIKQTIGHKTKHFIKNCEIKHFKMNIFDINRVICLK